VKLTENGDIRLRLLRLVALMDPLLPE